MNYCWSVLKVCPRYRLWIINHAPNVWLYKRTYSCDVLPRPRVKPKHGWSRLISLFDITWQSHRVKQGNRNLPKNHNMRHENIRCVTVFYNQLWSSRARANRGTIERFDYGLWTFATKLLKDACFVQTWSFAFKCCVVYVAIIKIVSTHNTSNAASIRWLYKMAPLSFCHARVGELISGHTLYGRDFGRQIWVCFR